MYIPVGNKLKGAYYSSFVFLLFPLLKNETIVITKIKCLLVIETRSKTELISTQLFLLTISQTCSHMSK
jgi:hypothetical protein